MSIAPNTPSPELAKAARSTPGRPGKAPLRNTLKPLREHQGWTQRELAAKTKCSRAYIIGLEGGGVPSLPIAFRLARNLNKPVEQIFLPDWVKLPEPASA